MGGTEAEQLLTEDEKRAYLHKLFGHRFTHQGKLQLPSLRQYNSLGSASGIQSVGIEMCRWIGVRIPGLHIRFGYTSGRYQIDEKHKTIFIHASLQNHPYSCGATIALAIIEYAISRAKHEQPDAAIIEFAAVELGLGIWIINAMRPQVKHSRKLYHILNSSWEQRESITLRHHSAQSFTNRVLEFAHKNRIPPEDYLSHIPKRCHYLLPKIATKYLDLHLPEPEIYIKHRTAARIFWIKVTLCALTVATGISLTAYIYSQRTPAGSQQNHEQLQIIESLRNQHSECQHEASRQQSNYDPNDLFLARQIDATKSRCESLRNQYNYAVDQYQLK